MLHLLRGVPLKTRATRRPQKGTEQGPTRSNRDMIYLDTEDHLFLARDYTDITSQLLEHLMVENDEDLRALAAACLRCTDLDVMIIYTEG